MNRTRMSELKHWAIKHPLTARALAAVLLLAMPLLIPVVAFYGFLVHGLSAFHKGDLKEVTGICSELFAHAFLPWENDL